VRYFSLTLRYFVDVAVVDELYAGAEWRQEEAAVRQKDKSDCFVLLFETGFTRYVFDIGEDEGIERRVMCGSIRWPRWAAIRKELAMTPPLDDQLSSAPHTDLPLKNEPLQSWSFWLFVG
jgi:hypothetical protein